MPFSPPQIGRSQLLASGNLKQGPIVQRMYIGPDDRRRSLPLLAGGIQLGLLAAALYFSALSAIANEPAGASVGTGPLVVTPKGDDAVLEISLDQWNAYLDRREQQKIEAAKEFAPEGLQLPKGRMASDKPLNIWSTAEVMGIAVDPAGQGHATALGAALKLGHGLNLGVGTERHEDQDQEKFINKAGLQARLNFNNWKLVPQATLIDEQTTNRSGATDDTTMPHGSATALASTRIELAPEIRRSMKLENGGVLEPFVNFTSQIGLDGSVAENATGDNTIDKVGVGLNLSQPDQYKLEATADFDGLGENEKQEINSRVKLTVPLD